MGKDVKKCPCCLKNKTKGMFNKSKNRKDGLDVYCRQCVKAKHKKYYESNPDKFKKKRKERKRYTKNIQLFKKYGITLDTYERMLVEQDNLCKICNKKETAVVPVTKEVKRLCVDHCHDTLKVRGLLCKSCNIAIGEMKDSVETLEKAISYLKGEL